MSSGFHALAGFEVVDSEEGGEGLGEGAEGGVPGRGLEGDGVDRFREFGQFVPRCGPADSLGVFLDGGHLAVVQAVGGVGGLMVVLPVAAGEEEVGHTIPAEDAMVTHVTDILVEGGDELHALRDGNPGEDIGEFGVTFGALISLLEWSNPDCRRHSVILL